MPKWKSKGRGIMIPLNQAAEKIHALTGVAHYTLQKAEGLYKRMVREHDKAKSIYDDAVKQLKTASDKYKSLAPKEVLSPKEGKEKK